MWGSLGRKLFWSLKLPLRPRMGFFGSGKECGEGTDDFSDVITSKLPLSLDALNIHHSSAMVVLVCVISGGGSRCVGVGAVRQKEWKE